MPRHSSFVRALSQVAERGARRKRTRHSGSPAMPRSGPGIRDPARRSLARQRPGRGVADRVGGLYAPATQPVAALAAAPRPQCLGGARLVPAGRMGPGFLVLREAAAMAPPVPATRWRCLGRQVPADRRGCRAAEGDDRRAGKGCRAFRRLSELPAVLLATLPASVTTGSGRGPRAGRSAAPAPQGSGWSSAGPASGGSSL